jgi:H+-transporting ATPase
MRDGAWNTLPAAEVAPADVMRVSLGGIIPIDLLFCTGWLLFNQPMLTGESLPLALGPRYDRTRWCARTKA